MKIPFLIFILFCLIFIFSCTNKNNSLTEPIIGTHVGDKAPNFQTTDINGDSISLVNFLNKKVVLLHFWATWCPYSRNSIPNVKNLWDKYRKRNFVIISISRDYDLNALKSYINSYSLDWIHILDNRFDVNQFYHVSIIPMCFLIDKNGIIKFANSPIEPNLETLINELTK